jgi:hypothetical protein
MTAVDFSHFYSFYEQMSKRNMYYDEMPAIKGVEKN